MEREGEREREREREREWRCQRTCALQKNRHQGGKNYTRICTHTFGSPHFCSTASRHIGIIISDWKRRGQRKIPWLCHVCLECKKMRHKGSNRNILRSNAQKTPTRAKVQFKRWRGIMINTQKLHLCIIGPPCKKKVRICNALKEREKIAPSTLAKPIFSIEVLLQKRIDYWTLLY